jgi:hypothetical protein
VIVGLVGFSQVRNISYVALRLEFIQVQIYPDPDDGEQDMIRKKKSRESRWNVVVEVVRVHCWNVLIIPGGEER